ncbi:MAG: relaxase/mobilization nuclease domain-containing protein [Anaerocolumna sp.]
MAHIQFVESSYDNNDAVEKVINYFIRPDINNKIYVGGMGVNIYSADTVIADFYRIKKLYEKIQGRQVRHCILAFDMIEEVFTPEQAINLAYQVTNYYCDYQAFFAVHTDTSYLHIHFCFNTVSYVNGTMYREGSVDLELFKEYAKECIKQELKNKY